MHIFVGCVYILIKCVECSRMARETGVQSQVESNQKFKICYLIPLHYKPVNESKMGPSR